MCWLNVLAQDTLTPSNKHDTLRQASSARSDWRARACGTRSRRDLETDLGDIDMVVVCEYVDSHTPLPSGRKLPSTDTTKCQPK